MSIELYIGSADDITARLAGAPSSTTTTITAVTSARVFTVASASTFAAGGSVNINQQRAVIESIVGLVITLVDELAEAPGIADVVRHYDANYTKYRDPDESRLTFVLDRRNGGSTGDAYGNDIALSDSDGIVAKPTNGSRILLVDSADRTTALFSGVISFTERSMIGRDNSNRIYNGWSLQCHGYQWEADANGIEEDPVYKINSGTFLRQLVEKYTTLEIGEIDEVNSPLLDFIRLSNYRRLSSVGQDLASLWPEGEFFIDNDLTNGKVYFRLTESSYAPIVLDESYLIERGAREIIIQNDAEKVFNIVRLPFYLLQRREPDFFVQDTVVDEAFLKTSVTLNGIPANVESSLLVLDDFADGDLSEDFVEDDLTNSSPPSGFNNADGFLVEGEVNGVTGLTLLDTSGYGAVSLGDIGRITDPGVFYPFTGEERQLVMAKEVVINTLGEAVVLGVTDQTTRTATITSASSSTVFTVDDASHLAQDDRITVGVQKTYISSKSGNQLTVSPALSGTPSNGTTVSLHRLAKSRIKFGVYFKASGDLKYIKDGVETAFGTPRTYTTATYSLRLYMQCFETTIASGISSTGCTLADASNLATGDVVEIFTSGPRSEPEQVVITKSGSSITYAATSNTPVAGYRVRSLPKLVLQIKGGAFGDINARTWTTLYTATNSWQTVANTLPTSCGLLVALHKTLVATISLFWAKNPPGVTGMIGSRYLHIATQEVETSEPDVDCIIRKVGTHYQLDFFGDTKSLWSSGTRLALYYSELFERQLEKKDPASMRRLAKQRGFTVSDTITEDELTRLGGRAMDTVELLPYPITISDAVKTAISLLDAVKEDAWAVEMNSNTYSDAPVKPGQIIKSLLADVPDVLIERVRMEEIPGTANDEDNGRTVYVIKVQAGTVDRLEDILFKRRIKNGQRLVLDDGVRNDSFSKLQEVPISEVAIASDEFTTAECTNPTRIVLHAGVMVKLMCLEIA